LTCFNIDRKAGSIDDHYNESLPTYKELNDLGSGQTVVPNYDEELHMGCFPCDP